MNLWIGTDAGLYCNDEAVGDFGTAKIKCLAGDGDTLWAATDETLWHHDGDWQKRASFPTDVRPRYLLPTSAGLLVGTSGAQVLRFTDDVLALDDAFAAVSTRDHWHTPWGGPPSIWSMCASPAGDIWANVHVGGLVRSADGGHTWQQTPLDIEVDVHQVNWDPATESLVVATANGFGESDDGAAWRFDTEGLHAHYLRSATVSDGHRFVCASRGPQSDEADIYRRARGSDAFERCAPAGTWLSANVDAPAITTSGTSVAFGTADGRVFQSDDDGDSWNLAAEPAAPVRCVLIAA